jgi:hypothetical protein
VVARISIQKEVTQTLTNLAFFCAKQADEIAGQSIDRPSSIAQGKKPDVFPTTSSIPSRCAFVIRLRELAVVCRSCCAHAVGAYQGLLDPAPSLVQGDILVL